MIRIDDRIWGAWQGLIDDGLEPSVLMRLSPAGDRTAVVGAVRESVMEILRPRIVRMRESDEHDPPRPGEWEWFGVPGGVLVAVADCDPFEEMLGELAASLKRRGVDGALDLHEWPTPPTPRPLGQVLSCHLRVRGRRLRVEPLERASFTWEPDPDAHAAIITAVDRWCRQLGEQATYKVTKGTIGPVPFGLHEATTGALREALAEGVSGSLDGDVGGAWREVGVSPYVGSVGLAVGGADLDAGRWPPALEELTGLLREHANLIAYAYVRRRSQPGVFHDSLERDWPQRPNDRPRGGGFTKEAFEDVFAPDAFAVQLLGPGYAGRLPEARGYRHEPVSEQAVLLEPVDLAAWFDAPFVPHGEWRAADEPVPAVLARAREELAPILYTPGALSRAGYTDLAAL